MTDLSEQGVVLPETSYIAKRKIRKNLSGKIFGRLTVIAHDELYTKKTKWICRCICGKVVSVTGIGLANGSTASCGCLKHDVMMNRQVTHAMTGSREHRIWMGMKNRCYNESYSRYYDYGGRGITVCPEWINSFTTFYRDMGRCPSGKSLERTDNSLGYSAKNCIWATRKQQQNNMRSNVFWEAFGITKNRRTWAKSLGIAANSIDWALAHGKTLEEYIIKRNLQDRVNNDAAVPG